MSDLTQEDIPTMEATYEDLYLAGEEAIERLRAEAKDLREQLRLAEQDRNDMETLMHEWIRTSNSAHHALVELAGRPAVDIFIRLVNDGMNSKKAIRTAIILSEGN